MSYLRSLSSFALMSVNWEENKKDFIDLLKPFIIFGICPPNYKVISINDVHNKVKENFGIEIPRNIIEYILNRLVKEKLILKENNTYKYITGYDLNKEIEPFIESKEKYIEDQETIIDEFIYYCKLNLNLEYTREQSERIILNYLDKYSHNIFLNINLDKINIDEDYNYIMGRFLKYLLEEKKSVYLKIEKIIKGFLIANSMYDSNIKIDKTNMKFKNTYIYFDTTFLLYSLGYHGDELKASCLELINILQDLGVKLRVHNHVINEMKSILDAYINLYDSGRLSESYNFEYFLETGKSSSTVMLYKSNLEKNLNRINIKIEETPDYKNDNVYIDHKKLEEHLKNNIGYSGENADIAIRNDIESISSIYRLRNNKITTDIEDCKAIFMTTNATLVKEVNSFIIKQEKSLSQQFPPVITDINLTGIAWLKLPTKYPDLPKKTIIADAYSLQQPSKNFWDYYIEKVDVLLKEESITKEDALMLKYEASKKDLMEMTYGSKEKLSHNCIEKLLEEIKVKEQKELENELGNKQKELEQKNIIIEDERRKISDYISNECEKFANNNIKKHHKKKLGMKILVFFIILIINFINFNDTRKNKSILVTCILFIGLLIVIYTSLRDIVNFNNLDLKKIYEKEYLKYYEKKKIELKKELKYK